MDLGNQCKGGTIVRLQGKKLTVQNNHVGDKEEVVWLGTKAPELQAVYFMKFFIYFFFYHKDNMIAIVH